MRTVEQYMTPSPIAVLADCTIAEAREFMRRARVHHLPVLAGRKLVGLVDEGDLSALEDLSEMERHRLRVEDVMVPMPLVVSTAAPLAAVAREMSRARVTAAVVMNDGEVVGVFTLTDALRALGELLDAPDEARGTREAARARTRKEQTAIDT